MKNIYMQQITMDMWESANETRSIDKEILPLSQLKQNKSNEVLDFNRIYKVKNTNTEDVKRILAALLEIGKLTRKYLFFKIENNSYLNEAWEQCNGSLPKLFFDREVERAEKLRIACNDLFVLIDEDMTSKISIENKKTIYIKDVLKKIKSTLNFKYKGEVYSEKCKELNVTFHEFRGTLEHREIQGEYDEILKDKLKIIDTVLDEIRMYQDYIILERVEDCKLEVALEGENDIA